MLVTIRIYFYWSWHSDQRKCFTQSFHSISSWYCQLNAWCHTKAPKILLRFQFHVISIQISFIKERLCVHIRLNWIQLDMKLVYLIAVKTRRLYATCVYFKSNIMSKCKQWIVLRSKNCLLSLLYHSCYKLCIEKLKLSLKNHAVFATVAVLATRG